MLFCLTQFSGAAGLALPPDDTTAPVDYISKPTSLADSIVNYGRLFLNTPYRSGSQGPNSFDCSGFSSYVYRNFGYELKRSSREQAEQFNSVDKTSLKPGDLVFFQGRCRSKRVGHVGIVVSATDSGRFSFIHAANHGGVTISNSDEAYYAKRFLKAGRVLDEKAYVAPVFIEEKKTVEEPVVMASLPDDKVLDEPVKEMLHTVKAGESLFSIALKYNLTVDQLKKINNLKINSIKPNQLLIVTNTNAADSARSEVRVAAVKAQGARAKGKKVDAPVKSVQSEKEMTEEVANPAESATPENIKKNAVSSKSLVAEKTSQPEQATSSVETTHVVKKGETLYSIAEQYKVSVDDLKKTNHISRRGLKAGQEITINGAGVSGPVAAVADKSAKKKQESATTVYTVKKGETLSEIARKNNMTVAELKRLNHLGKKKLAAGQKITIAGTVEEPDKSETTEKVNPKKEQAVTSVYTVKKGETLSEIARKNNMTVAELLEINHLNKNKLTAGQEIKLIADAKTETAEPDKSVGKSDKESIKKQKIQTSHTVKPGENLYTISKKYNISVDDLKDANQLSSADIHPGDKLKIPAGGVVNEKGSVSASKEITHTIKKGENLYSIAKKFDCSVDDLKKWNDINGSSIKPGEKIKIRR